MAKRWTVEETQYLIDNYETKTLATIAIHLGRSKTQCSDRARYLGYKKRNRSEWSQEELKLLEIWAETRDFPALVCDWNRRASRNGWPVRSPNALAKTLSKMGLTRLPEVGCFRVPAVAAGLEISEGTVKAWIRNGKLKAKKQAAGDHSPYIVYGKELAEFALKYPREVADLLSKSGMCWLLQVIGDAKGRSPLYEYKKEAA